MHRPALHAYPGMLGSLLSGSHSHSSTRPGEVHWICLRQSGKTDRDERTLHPRMLQRLGLRGGRSLTSRLIDFSGHTERCKSLATEDPKFQQHHGILTCWYSAICSAHSDATTVSALHGAKSRCFPYSVFYRLTRGHKVIREIHRCG